MTDPKPHLDRSYYNDNLKVLIMIRIIFIIFIGIIHIIAIINGLCLRRIRHFLHKNLHIYIFVVSVRLSVCLSDDVVHRCQSTNLGK